MDAVAKVMNRVSGREKAVNFRPGSWQSRFTFFLSFAMQKRPHFTDGFELFLRMVIKIVRFQRKTILLPIIDVNRLSKQTL